MEGVPEAHLPVFDTKTMAQDGDVVLTFHRTYEAGHNWLPLSLSVQWMTDVKFFLSQKRNYFSPYRFRPRDAREPDLADCSTYPDDCHSSFQVHTRFFNPLNLSSGDPPLPISVSLSLEPPAFRPVWLAGASTNYGAKADQDASGKPRPDFVFEAAQNPSFLPPSADGLTISSPPLVNNTPTWSPTVVVTSRDYGGAGNIRARINVSYNNSSYSYEVPVVDPDPPDGRYCGVPPCYAWTPPAIAGTGAFLPFPLDRDGNGQPDWWEGQYTTPGGGHLDPQSDGDRGAQGSATPTDLLGDGLPAHDEYRGFHVLDATSGKSKWISTDPTRYDLFYWDPDHIGRTNSDPIGNAAFHAILGATTASFMDLHPVNTLFANGNRAAKTNKAAMPINKYSLFKQRSAYAVIYANAKLERGTIGRSGEENEFDFSMRSAGTPIYVDKAQIQSAANIPVDTLLAQTIAHETGHKLSRDHPQRCADTPLAYDVALAPTLKIDEFMQESRKLTDLSCGSRSTTRGVSRSGRRCWSTTTR